MLTPGRVVDRYVVERPLGTGPDGERYLVRHAHLDTPLVLVVGTGPAAVARLDAIRTRAALVHPRVVRILDWLEVDGAPALVREHVEAPTLADRLGSGGLGADEARAVAGTVLLLLALAADRGLAVGVPTPDRVYLAPTGPRVVVDPPGGSLPELLEALAGAARDPGLRALGAAATELSPASLWEVHVGGRRSGLGSPLGLPPIPRALVGREEELRWLIDSLIPEGAAATVIGTAGVGKTRLALEAAHHAAGPVVFVDLTAATTVEVALATICWSLGADRDSLDTLAPLVEEHPGLLVVLDNVEQLPPTFASAVDDLRAAAPGLRLVLTSRHRVGVRDERVGVLEPLPVPASAAELEGSASWALLRLAAPPGALDGADPERAVALLQALDGLPLAVLLAAARLEILDLDELCARLGDRFGLLASPGDSAERHGSLLAAFEASWSLLSPDERRLMTDLSAFAGPVPVERVEAVSGLPDVRVLLDRLVDRSLVVRRGPGRYGLLASLRAFADRALDPDRRRALHLRHATVFAELAALLRGDPGSRAITDPAAEWSAVLDRAETDPALIHCALAAAHPLISLTLRRGPAPRALELADRARALILDPAEHLHAWGDLALLRARALRQVLRGEEGERTLEELLARPDLPPDYRAAAHAHLADSLGDRLDSAGARAHTEAAIRLARVHGPRSLLATAHARLGELHAVVPEERALAIERYEAALAAVPPGDRPTEIEVLKRYGWARLLWDHAAEAEALLVRCRDLASASEDRRTVASVSGQLGMCRELTGDLPGAEEAYETAADLLSGQSEARLRRFWSGSIGRILVRRGRFAEGVRRIEESGALALGEDWSALLRVVRAAALIGLGRIDEALAERLSDPERSSLIVLASAARALADGRRSDVHAALTAFGDGPVEEAFGRAALRAVADAIAEQGRAWWIDRDGGWFEAPDGRRVALGRPVANVRILALLSRRRASHPGEQVDLRSLAAEGWPGDQVVDKAAANRVYVALSGLRKLGLEPVLARSRAGWRLDPAAPIRICGAPADAG